MLTPTPSRQSYMNLQTGKQTLEDPRLDLLPPEWMRMTYERTPDDPAYFARFRNNATGEVINSDPRLSPEALRARGVELETFSLI